MSISVLAGKDFDLPCLRTSPRNDDCYSTAPACDIWRYPGSNYGIPLLTKSTQHQGAIGSTEDEGIRQRNVDFHPSGSVWHVVEITLRILIEHIDRRRRDLINHGQDGKYGFHSARRAEQMARAGLGGTDCQFFCMISETALHRDGFSEVTERRGRAVRIDVIHLVRIDS